MSLTAARILLPLISASALYFIFYQSWANGTKDLADASIAAGIITIPGSKGIPLRTHYTGLPHTDRLLATLTTFFWPVVDGQHPGLFLHSLTFSGTFGAAWVLVVLEGWRKGNAWTVVAFPFIFGLGAQVFTIAMSGGAYAALHVLTSETASNPSLENMRIPRAVLIAMPVAFTIGQAVPSLAMALPLSDRLTPDLKQILIAVWQPWPAYVAALLTVAYVLLGPYFDSYARTARGIRKDLKPLRATYAFAFGTAAVSHLVAVVVSLATIVAPFLFEKRFVRDLHPAKVLATALPWKLEQVKSVGEGVHVFLRWDYNICVLGMLVWALALYRVAERKYTGTNEDLSTLSKVVQLTLLTGPVGAAVELMWEREEFVIEAEPKSRIGLGGKALH